MGRRLGVAFHTFFGRRDELVKIMRRIVATEVISHRCQKIRFGRAVAVARGLGLKRELFVAGRGDAPLATPAVPSSNPLRGGHQVVVIDSLDDHARRPGFENVIDGRVEMGGEHDCLLV